MLVKVEKWKKGLGISLPTAMRDDLSLKEGSRLLARKMDQGWLLQSVPALPVMPLNELVAGINPENLPDPEEPERAWGREFW